MSPLFQKLNLGAHRVIHVLNAPASFAPELAALGDVAVKTTVRGPVSFALAFVMTQDALDAACTALCAAAEGDAALWMVYPKTTSKKYRCEFNRDSGWPLLGAAGFEPVRMVAVDADWSALRFRRADYIKRMTRHPAGAISAAGRGKTTGKSTSK